MVQLLSGIGLILLVLLHSAKGEGLGSIGTQARVFASQKGLETGLNKLTTVFASLFMLASLLLGMVR